jgi:hypothetical protein
MRASSFEENPASFEREAAGCGSQTDAVSGYGKTRAARAMSF